MRVPELKARPRDSSRPQRWAAAKPRGPKKQLSSGWEQGPGTTPSHLTQRPCPSARSFCHLLPKRRQCCQGPLSAPAGLLGLKGARWAAGGDSLQPLRALFTYLEVHRGQGTGTAWQLVRPQLRGAASVALPPAQIRLRPGCCGDGWGPGCERSV